MDTSPIYHFKILVSAAVAGRFIGKGGTTIAQLQKDAGARVEMSKASEFYPGTTERVCLISGPIEGILKINDYFMENFSSTSIKILVPNSTADMIIGKGGSYIKQIKEESGAYVQISQKCTDLSLPERCVTIVGELENIRKACAMILSKIVEDVIDYILHDDKLKDLFDFYDVDGNGMIQRDELFNVLALCSHEMGLEVDTYLELIVDTVFSNANLAPCGSITYEGFQEVLRKRPNLLNELSLSPCNPKPKSPRSPCKGFANLLETSWENFTNSLTERVPLCNKLKREYISNNLVRFNFFIAIVLTSILLIGCRIHSYWNSCGFLILARASGQCLNFFCSIIVLLVCRRSISFLRSHGFGRYLPLDDHVYFHKMMGLFIIFHSLLHTFGHLLNFYLESIKTESKFTYVEYLFTTHTGIGWIAGSASITGWLLVLTLVVMLAAIPFSRNLGKFELFYYTHLLYIPFWILIFIHAPNFWKWFIVPFGIFLIEAFIRLQKLLTYLTLDGQTTIIKAVPLPSNVIHLVIKRPPNFDYSPGDWIYVLIPQIAKYEWHPFTISSAPEQDGVIWLHIRAVGEWTRSLRSFFEGVKNRNHLSKFIKSGQFSISIEQFSTTVDLSTDSDVPQLRGSSTIRNKINSFRADHSLAPISEHKSLDIKSSSVGSCETKLETSINSTTSTKSTSILPNIKILIDGPYGSPSSQIFLAEHAVLIATGIGVTPFASILQSIVKHYEKRRQKCPNCTYEFLDARPPLEFKLRKVDFVWINRDQKSFEWFIKLLAELECTQLHLPRNERFLDIHIHLTAMPPAKIKSIGLQLALYLVHEKNKKDLVTGLKTRTRVGRPNWNDFFEKIQEQKKGKVSVFFCGRPQLGRLLHRQCDSFGFKFRKEIF